MLFGMICLLVVGSVLQAHGEAAPAPYGPVPTEQQMRWHEMEYYGLICFGLNVYTGEEWGYGDVDTGLFNPVDLDTDQWASAAKESGMRGLILVAKHHDGFCLWPSKTTEYTVASTPWRDGKGDILKDLAASCRKYGLKLGVYISPWDRNHAEYGRPGYVKAYHDQWREVIEYDDEIFEVWFDGANGGSGYYGGAREKRSIAKDYYQYKKVFDIIKARQPKTIFFGYLPGVTTDTTRWVGNEHGHAPETSWCRFSDSSTHNLKLLGTGQKDGEFWMPSETDTTILRPKKWYYNPRSRPLTLKQFVDLYYTSVGRNSNLSLGLTPGPNGLFPDSHVEAMWAQKKQLDREFAVNLARSATVTASATRAGFDAALAADESTTTYWATPDGTAKASLMLEFGAPTTFNRLLLQEYIALGQRVHAFTLEIDKDGEWQTIASGTTIGYKRILRFKNVTAAKLRVTLETDAPCLTLSNIGLYNAPPLMYEPVISQDRSGMVSIAVENGLRAFVAVGGASATYTEYTAPFALPAGGVVNAYATDGTTKTDIITEEFGMTKSLWAIHAVSSEEGTNPATDSIDGNPKTIWHSEWQKAQPPHPHALAIDLGESVATTGFGYLPRQDGSKSALIFEYAFHVSEDGKRWGSPVSKGFFDNIENNPIRQVIKFKSAVRGRYIKLVSLSAVQDKPFASAAEIDVYTH